MEGSTEASLLKFFFFWWGGGWGAKSAEEAVRRRVAGGGAGGGGDVLVPKTSQWLPAWKPPWRERMWQLTLIKISSCQIWEVQIRILCIPSIAQMFSL